MVWQGSPHRWAVRCGHLAPTCTHTQDDIVCKHAHTQDPIPTHVYTALQIKTFLFLRHLSLVSSPSIPCPPSVLLRMFSRECVCLILCSLVSVITREGEQIRVFTRRDVYMRRHTCCPKSPCEGFRDARAHTHTFASNAAKTSVGMGLNTHTRGGRGLHMLHMPAAREMSGNGTRWVHGDACSVRNVHTGMHVTFDTITTALPEFVSLHQEKTFH